MDHVDDKYKKFYEIKELLDRYLDLGYKLEEHYADMFNSLKELVEKEKNGTLTDEEKGKIEAHIKDLESYIEKFISDREKEINEQLAVFDSTVKKMLERIAEVKAMFVLEISSVEESVGLVIARLTAELDRLVDEAKKIIAEMDDLKKLVGGYTKVQIAHNYADIMKTIEDLKKKILDIKKEEIRIFNLMVDSVKKQLESLLEVEGLTADMIAEIQMKIGMAGSIYYLGVVSRWNHNYKPKYTELKELFAFISVIRKTIVVPFPVENPEIILTSKIEYIEKKMTELETEYKEDMSEKAAADLNIEIIDLENEIDKFETLLNNSKETIGEEKYNEFKKRLDSVKERLSKLKSKVRPIPLPGKNLYEKLKNELKFLEIRIADFSFLVDSLKGKVTTDSVKTFLDKLDMFEASLNEVVASIETAYEEGKLDKNQYEELNKIVEGIKKTLEEDRTKVNDPEFAKDVDVFTFLNGQIDGVENAITALEMKIDSFEKIKKRKDRKDIDEQFKRIEKEIKDIEKFLEKYKDEDQEKYNAAVERLNNAKNRLNELGKKYRKKCPLLVRAVKSAKEFYKRHKKVILIVAGLAAFALLSYHVIIPAIIHGNLMIGTMVPSLSGVTGFMNNILGNIIGATMSPNNICYLANGVRINASMASTSLLKGLAISGIGTAALVTPILVALKKLGVKGKLVEAKDKTKDLIDKQKEKHKTKKDERKKSKDDKKTTKKANKLAGKQIEESIADYYKASKKGMSLDEYCEKNELTDTDKTLLELYIAKAKLNTEELVENKGKGRK